MLYYETIDSKTLELLKRLMKIGEFKNLRLVGGTSLALQIGHRKSIDLDLFGRIEIDEIALSKILSNIGEVKTLQKSENIKIYLINGIKVDIVNYHYPWLEKELIEDNIRMCGLKDIAALKLSAITGRGTKKDFIDLFFLLQHFSLNEMLKFYTEKYKDGSELMVLKSLSYFIDADDNPSPVMINTSFNWDETKKYISQALNDFFSENH